MRFLDGDTKRSRVSSAGIPAFWGPQTDIDAEFVDGFATAIDAGYGLMKLAGQKLFEKAIDMLGESPEGKSVAVFVGGGNNGGDGYALAGILKNNGIDSVIYKVSDKMSDDGKYYMEIAEKLGVSIEYFDENTNLNEYDVIVDCILGTGFVGEVHGKARDAIEAINKSNAYVISVDINSGMNGDTGEASLAVKSNLTVSIGYYKKGLFTEASKKYIKEKTNVDIGIVLI